MRRFRHGYGPQSCDRLCGPRWYLGNNPGGAMIWIKVARQQRHTLIGKPYGRGSPN